MKKMILSAVIAILGITQMSALSVSSIRNHARFISDRMAYELDLSASQYDDVYEINYDFLYAINRIMDDVVIGYHDAIDRYYDYLDERNDDLRYVLSLRQYNKFIDAEYFYRPIYTTHKSWSFRIYTVYHNTNFFYYDAPSHYKVYVGAHSRRSNTNYYSHRYDKQKNDRYTQNHRISNSNRRTQSQRNDFGANVRRRDDQEKNKVNNYKNPNDNNRTNNRYYQDNSGNKHAQEINTRNKNKGGKEQNSRNNNVTIGTQTRK